MFHFKKKDKDKEKKEKREKNKKDEKQEKKGKEKKERQNVTQEENSRLQGIKRSLLRRFSDKNKKYSSHHSSNQPDPSGSEDNAERSSLAQSIQTKEVEPLSKPHLSTDQPPLSGREDIAEKLSLVESSPTEEAEPLPVPQPFTDLPLSSSTSNKEVPPADFPKPAMKSILKGKVDIQLPLAPVPIDDPKLLEENTRQNEEFFIEQVSSKKSTVLTQKDQDIISCTSLSTLSASISDLISEEDDIKSKPFESSLKLPVIIPPKPQRIREIRIQRMHSGGFGFSLRKGFIPGRRGGSSRAVTFAEPGSGLHSSQTGLIPGDKLVEVNGQNIENLSRDEIAEIVKHSSDTITLKVQPMQELIELSVRPYRDGTISHIMDDTAKNDMFKTASIFRYKPGARSEDDDIKLAKEWLETEKVWLIHRGGFSEASLLKSENADLHEGRVRVRLESRDIVEVDEDDIEKANPPQFDKAEDLATLRNLNESSMLHTLRQRFASSLIHTFAGPNLIIINPMQQLPVYANKIVQMLKDCMQEDMPPHIFSKAQVLYQNMLSSRADQSLLLMGKSGSGKTTNSKHTMHYLISAAGSCNGVLTVEKLRSVYTVLSAFGNCRTILNINASRFTQIFTINFDHAGRIGSASVQAMMLEKTRVVRRPQGEQTFHVFYHLLAGADSNLRNDLQLQSLSETNSFLTPLQKPGEREEAVEEWQKLLQAFDNLNFTENEVKAILSILASIFHLGSAGAMKGSSNKPHFENPAATQKAAALLGATAQELSKAIFSTGGAFTPSHTHFFRSPKSTDKPAYLPSDNSSTAQECLEGFVIGLYGDVFNAVVSLINRSIASGIRATNSITIVDCPGLQSSGAGLHSGRNSGATFEDLCHNYTQERLQAFFHEVALSTPQEIYEEENIILDFDLRPSSSLLMVNLLDNPPQQGLIRSPSSDMKNMEKKGLLWILEEEAMFSGATVDNFMKRLLEQPVQKDNLLRKGSLGHTFILNHNLGMTPILYNSQGWLKSCQENPVSRNASLVLQDSRIPSIVQLFVGLKGQSSATVSGSVVGMEELSLVHRSSSVRRALSTSQAGLKKRSVCRQVMYSVDVILDILKKTSVHFVHCILPQHCAGLEQQMPSQEECPLNVPLVRNQLKSFEILDALRLYRLSFPDWMPFAEFTSKFELLVPSLRKSGQGEGDEKLTVSLILDHLDIDKSIYRIGISRVFFRPGCLSQLTRTRDEKLAVIVTAYQALCRGYLGRKKLEKLKVQKTAVKCVQRNVRKYVQTRGWEWWRLYTKVKPLLNVHRTEEELKEKETEIEALKVRSERLEKERTEYRTQCDHLGNRLADVSVELAEERTTSNEVADLLQAEIAQRMRLENGLKDLQNKFTAARHQNEKLQMEVMQTRHSETETLAEDQGEREDNDSVYKSKCKRADKELQTVKRQLQQHKEEEREQELQLKKQIEKQLHEAVKEAEEQRRQAQVAKKKAQKLIAEMQDLRLHLEEQMSRNNELERKQRRFDTELNMAHENVRQEKAMKEKVQRERDELLTEKYSHEQTVQHAQREHQSLVEKCDRLEKEMTDLLLTGKDNSEAISLKRSKHQLEIRIEDQEEELDGQAGQIQQLEQFKLRLEMSMEKMKQQHQKELDDKDEEVEEMRHKTQKKLRQLEDQLEEEYGQKKRIQEAKAQLEKQLQTSGQKDRGRDREPEKKLRRNLRKTKALLNDAGAALSKHKDIEASKAQISTMRNQLDDAEFSSLAALKAKKRLEAEVEELQQQLDDLARSKQEADSKSMLLLREKTAIESRLEEVEEDFDEVMKKYKAVVQQQSVDQITLTDKITQIEELIQERDRCKQEASELQARIQLYDSTMVDKHKVERLESKVRDLESRLELETTTRHRLEGQVSRVKEQIDRVTLQKEDLNMTKMSAEEANKRVQKQLRDLREEFGEMQKRELETVQSKKELETKVTDLESECQQQQSDLKLALKRITDLQAALEEDLNNDSDDFIFGSNDDDNSSDESDINACVTNPKGDRNRSYSHGMSSHWLSETYDV